MCSGPGATDYVHADLRDPGLIIERASQTLDFSQPAGLPLIAPGASSFLWMGGAARKP